MKSDVHGECAWHVNFHGTTFGEGKSIFRPAYCDLFGFGCGCRSDLKSTAFPTGSDCS